MDINRGEKRTLIKFIDGTCLFDPVLFLFLHYLNICSVNQ